MAANERRPVAEFTSGQMVDQVFMITQPQLRTTTKGDYYVAAFLSDKSGKVNSRMWNTTEEIFKTLPNEGFVWVRGRVEMYQNSLQIVIDSIRPVQDKEVQFSQFVPSTDKDVNAMFEEVKKILAAVKNPHLARLIQAFLADEPLMKRFRTAPAAIALHHAYLGGLLEHTLSLLQLGQLVLQHYPRLDKDLILTALFLHDIGKTGELSYDVSFRYSNQGRLIGHLVMGVMMIQEKTARLNQAGQGEFPTVLTQSLEHIIVSHHGQREFGCPVLPSTPEAFAVHYIDNLDSKVALTFSEIDNDMNDTEWTNYVKALDAPLYKIRPQ